MGVAKLNSIDKVVGWFSPRAGARRAYYRAALAQYEGAGTGRRTKHWNARNRSADGEARGDLTRLRARSRDLIRNNAFAAAAAREIPAHMVGTGMIPQAQGRTDRETQRVESLAKRWMDTTEIDAGGRLTFYGIQSQVARTVVESGECLVRRRRRRSVDGLTVPLQLQVLEPDHLDIARDGYVTSSGHEVVQGVEYDRLGRRVAYWLFPDHPGDLRAGRAQSKRVPAEDVAHIFRQDRPGQTRGIPWGSPILLTLRDYDEYEDAQLMRQKIAASYAVFYEDGDPASTATNAGNQDMEIPDKVEPGMFEVVPPGKSVKFASPPGVEGYDEYSTITLHKVATGFGVPYSVLTGDLRQVNFSSARMGWLSFQRDISQWQWHMLVPQLCEPVWQWFLEAASVAGLQRAPVSATWTPPRREMVDPAREVPAIRDAVRSGQITQYEAIRQQGYDPEDFLREVAIGNERMDRDGIIFDSDPRKVARSGTNQAAPPGAVLPWDDPDDEDTE